MPIFFLVGGFANSSSWQAARRNGQSAPRGSIRDCAASSGRCSRDRGLDRARIAGHLGGMSAGGSGVGSQLADPDLVPRGVSRRGRARAGHLPHFGSASVSRRISRSLAAAAWTSRFPRACAGSAGAITSSSGRESPARLRRNAVVAGQRRCSWPSSGSRRCRVTPPARTREHGRRPRRPISNTTPPRSRCSRAAALQTGVLLAAVPAEVPRARRRSRPCS